MGGCSAPFCNNSSKKGYIMKNFPKNPERRALWLKNVGRENWIPTDHSYLCEVHFSPEMWEQRTEHKGKLKPNAVPTIRFFIKEKIINYISEPSTSAAYISSTVEPDKQKEDNKTMINVQNKDYEIINDISEPSASAAYISSVDKSDKEKKCQQGKLKQIVRRQQLSLIKMQRKIRTLRSIIRILKSKVNNNKYKKALNSVFTEDQIEALFTKKRYVRNWSNETIKRALQFKFVCGANGYEELTRQGIPLPSLRTLRRRLEDLKFEHGISDVFNFVKHNKSYSEKETDLECGFLEFFNDKPEKKKTHNAR